MEPEKIADDKPNTLSPTGLVAVVQRAVAVFGDDAGEALVIVDRSLAEAEQFRGDAEYAGARAFLVAMKNFNTAMLLSQQGDFATGVDLMSQAKQQFSTLGGTEFCDTAHGLELYLQGVAELQRQNFSHAVELLEEAPQYLRRAGDFGNKFRPIIDHIAPDALVAAGAVALMKQDFARGRVLLEDAAKKSEFVAATYYEEDTPNWFFFTGVAKLYRALFTTVQLYSQFIRFDFDRIDRARDANANARAARELLAKSDLRHKVRQNNYQVAGVLQGVLDVLPAAAGILHKLIATQSSTGGDYAAMRARLKAAEDDAVASGEQGLQLLLMCQQLAGSLDNLQRYDEARPAAAATSATAAGPIRLFVMMPFSDDAKVVEEALLAVFEGDPYWFDVILARDRTLRGNLFENVKAHMALVDGFVADVSNHNPNVMLELGMTENDPRGRPVLILRREGSAEPISDLKGRLYVEYSMPTGTPADQVASIIRQLRAKLGAIEDIEQLLARRQRRYLSQQYIAQKRIRLEPFEIERLQKAFPTVEDLEIADVDTVVRKTGFDEPLAAQIAQAFKATKPRG